MNIVVAKMISAANCMLDMASSRRPFVLAIGANMQRRNSDVMMVIRLMEKITTGFDVVVFAALTHPSCTRILRETMLHTI